MIKAIIFDYGNVISSVNNRLFLEEVSHVTGKTMPELNKWIVLCRGQLRKYETGMISSDDFFRNVVIAGGMALEKDDFHRLFTGRFTPVAETRTLIKKLKGEYKLGLLSNTNEWDYESEIKQCEIFGLFDTITVSFRVGAMKPDKRIYHDALGKLNVKPEECLYIDDIQEYAEAAEAVGMKGIHYTSPDALIDALRQVDCSLEKYKNGGRERTRTSTGFPTRS